jgi:hypothetical protein
MSRLSDTFQSVADQRRFLKKIGTVNFRKVTVAETGREGMTVKINNLRICTTSAEAYKQGQKRDSKTPRYPFQPVYDCPNVQQNEGIALLFERLSNMSDHEVLQIRKGRAAINEGASYFRIDNETGDLIPVDAGQAILGK